jgi:hypothetical protein
MDDSTYVNFYRYTARGYVILDNSVMELGSAVDTEFLEKAIYQFMPRELVLPDVPQDDGATYLNAERYAPYFKDKFPDLKLMAVPQGENLVCWMKDYYKYLQIPEVDVIGIPKHRKEMRLDILEAIDKDRPPRWEHHLLGTWGNPALELPRVAQLFSWVRGVDTKLPVRLGRLGIALHPDKGLLFEGRYALPDMPFDAEDDPFPIISQHNIDVVERWVDGTESSPRGLRLVSSST